MPVPLNKIQGRGLFKYDLSQMPPKRKKTADSVKTSSKKTSTTTVICNDSLVMEEDMSTDLHKGFVSLILKPFLIILIFLNYRQYKDNIA